MHLHRTVFAIFAALAFTGTAQAATPHLLVDDSEVASSRGLTRVVSTPAKLPEPIIDGARDHNYTPYVSVIRESGVFRMWYAAKLSDTELRLGYTTSRDGIHFGARQMLPVPAGYQWGASVIRDTTGYLMPYYARALASGAEELKGISFARSSDGLAWRATTAEPKYRLGELGLGLKDGDITSMVRFQGRYLLFVKMGGSGYTGVTANMPYPGYRRLVGVMESRDGVTWSLPRRIFAPDSRDEGITEFYGLGGVVQRGGLLVGMLRVLRDDLPANAGGPVEGLGYTVLAWSRDGIHWERDRKPFLDRGEPGSWDRAMGWADAQVVAGNRTLVYYGGYLSGHKTDWQTGRQLGVATMMTDRYVARAGTGRLVTKLVRLQGRLTVNASGSVRVILANAQGRTVASCLAGGVDGVARRVPCAAGVKGAVRVTFSLRSASLFAFTVG